ncbi:Uu.00g069200.m01.CDS01 [Anthostomella pinea]|uniref:Uu.00g069200.m01.CDS01 n=1 Tax=Anthostomella pinea TaxID=933095 RepID=A0AAI8VVB2_9PEZI|nr:Uu.00g069200.m01.CDS01 [Anthostomella pinea]
MASSPATRRRNALETGGDDSAEWFRTAYHDMATADVVADKGGLDAWVGFKMERSENIELTEVITPVSAKPYGLDITMYPNAAVAVKGEVRILDDDDMPSSKELLPRRVCTLPGCTASVSSSAVGIKDGSSATPHDNGWLLTLPLSRCHRTALDVAGHVQYAARFEEKTMTMVKSA